MYKSAAKRRLERPRLRVCDRRDPIERRADAFAAELQHLRACKGRKAGAQRASRSVHTTSTSIASKKHISGSSAILRLLEDLPRLEAKGHISNPRQWWRFSNHTLLDALARSPVRIASTLGGTRRPCFCRAAPKCPRRAPAIRRRATNARHRVLTSPTRRRRGQRRGRGT